MNGYTRTALLVVIAGGIASFALFGPRAQQRTSTEWVVVQSEQDGHTVRFQYESRAQQEALEVTLRRVEEQQREAIEQSREAMERSREAMQRAREEMERSREEARRAAEEARVRIEQSGVEGEAVRIRIRGDRVQADADGRPLIYVDGVRMDPSFDVQDIDPERVDRIEVLKNAAAVARFGEDARDGVIQIFLKPQG